jgi:ppGpp synthetase/RelA/SpoT-type nucleotidyltranferase
VFFYTTYMKKKTQKLVNEYKEKRFLYEDFCLTIRRLIESLLINKGYKFHISSRTKDLEKLGNKIELGWEKGKKYRQLSDIEDLAGVRIIFYLEKALLNN